MRCLLQIACVCLPVALAACGGGNSQDALSVTFPTAPLPMYSRGDSYTFDDGTVDTVVGTANNTVQWRNESRSRFVTTRDVLLPPIGWADQAERGRRSFSAPDALFPLHPDSGVTVVAAATQRPNKGGPDTTTQESWLCRVGDSQRIHEAMGWFDTVRVDCSETEMPSGQSEQRTYFYAPSIGYYVQRVDRVGDAPPRMVRLVAWTDGNPPLPDSALQQRVAAIQRVLESQPNGAVVGWQDAAAQASGSVEPVSTARNEDGRWCRDFQEHIGAFGRRYALIGTACRETAGDWQVVNVGPLQAAAR
jgi:hypothetical protein